MAAGLGFKTFTTGEVLTAADVNGYLMQGILVFATEAARNSAITSPQEGQFAFTKDTNSLWYYTGSAWAASGATGDIEGVTAGVGISGGGTSGTVTITNAMATEISAKGDLIVGTGSQTFDNLPVGTNLYTLQADSSTATGLKYAASLQSTLTTTGDIIYASAANTPARLGIGSTNQVLTVSGGVPTWATAASSSFVGAVVYNTTEQSIANNTDTIAAFNSERVDTNGFHDNATNNSRITIPTGYAGKYFIWCNLEWASNTTGIRSVKLLISGSYPGATSINKIQNASTAGETQNEFFFYRDMSEGDYLQLQVKQTSGGNLNLGGSTSGYTIQFGVQYLGA